MKLLLAILFILILTTSCTDKSETPKRPNILWIVAEDLSPILPMYGDSTVVTPNLSRLAAEGVVYDRVFSPSGVCAPSRAALALGMYPTRIGANHMRTGPWFAHEVPNDRLEWFASVMPEKVPIYEAMPPAGSKMMSEHLRIAGYYCSNNSKQDYQFRVPLTAWDETSNQAHWRNRAKDQPFFSIFNIMTTHESQIWERAKDSLWVDQNLRVPVPPYLPTTDSSLIDIRRLYSNIKTLDAQVGDILNQLEEDGLLEETIVVFYSDHGGPLPRQKRLLYDSGLRVPMIIRFPHKEKAGTRDPQMVSFIDFAPTTLSLAGIPIPVEMDGKAFLGDARATSPRQYIHAAADRFDESYDAIRAVRDMRYKYIQYLRPELPMFLHVGYRDQMPIMRELYRLRDNGTLDESQAQWFRETKPTEELFDTEADPYELHNIAMDPDMQIKLAELKAELNRWIEEKEDLNRQPELVMIDRFWPEGVQPSTAAVQIDETKEGVILSCPTLGASIAYREIRGQDTSPVWQVFHQPIRGNIQGLVTKAQRIGYLPSDVQTFNLSHIQ